jgi:uncharacterized membrane protein
MMEFLANIHPKIVHFPIAFLMLYPVFELLFLVSKKDFYNKVAFIFLLIGVVGSFFAVLSGNQAFETLKNIPDAGKDIFNEHQLYANITVWFFTFILALRYYFFIKKKLSKNIIALFLILSIIGCYVVYQTGNYGGKFSNRVLRMDLREIPE